MDDWGNTLLWRLAFGIPALVVMFFVLLFLSAEISFAVLSFLFPK